MYNINKTSRFKKDFKKMKNNKKDYFELSKVISCFVNNKKLPIKYKEHSLHGELKNCLECHVRPDLVLIYRKNIKLKQVDLLRIGSHSNF